LVIKFGNAVVVMHADLSTTPCFTWETHLPFLHKKEHIFKKHFPLPHPFLHCLQLRLLLLLRSLVMILYRGFRSLSSSTRFGLLTASNNVPIRKSASSKNNKIFSICNWNRIFQFCDGWSLGQYYDSVPNFRILGQN